MINDAVMSFPYNHENGDCPDNQPSDVISIRNSLSFRKRSIVQTEQVNRRREPADSGLIKIDENYDISQHEQV